MSRIRSVEYSNTSSDGSVIYIRAVIDCDSASDLPAVNAFAPKQLLIGSRAHDIDQNAWYEMQSSGTWVLQDAGTAAYTKAEVDSLIAAAVSQAVSDASALIIPAAYGLGTQIPNSSDFDNYNAAGVFYVGSNASAATMTNIPAQYGGRLEVKYSISSSYFFQEYVTNSTPVQKFIRRKISGGFSAWQEVTYI